MQENIQLSILIPTIEERRDQFERLHAYLTNLIDLDGFNGQVEILFLRDNKEETIGEKREKLYQMAQGYYSWQIDDDDEVSHDAILKIIKAGLTSYDCITFEEKCLIDGKEYRSNFSLKYADWGENQDGFDYVRTPFFKTPIKSSICKKVPVEHIRFGEDHAFARAIRPLLKTEIHIPKQLYYYIHNSTPFAERYGIKTS